MEVEQRFLLYSFYENMSIYFLVQIYLCENMSINMLYRLLFVLFIVALSSQQGCGGDLVHSDASKDSNLPKGASIATHGRFAGVEYSGGKLKLTTGVPDGSATVAIRFTPQGDCSTKPLEIVLDLEKLSGRTEETYPALWAGLLVAGTGEIHYFPGAGKWCGAVVELKELPTGGQFGLALRERWEMEESPEWQGSNSVTESASRLELCTLTRFPKKLKVRFENGKAVVIVEGAEVGVVGKATERIPSDEGVQHNLNSQTVEILKGDMEPVFGLSNCGTLGEASVALLNGFSISE